MAGIQQLGDVRSGKLAGNIAAFGRALRRAGVRTDAMRIGLAAEAAMLVGVDSRGDLASAMEAVMISREEDRLVFRELFDAWFRDPELANKLLAQMLPSAEGKAEPSKRRPRVREALANGAVRSRPTKAATCSDNTWPASGTWARTIASSRSRSG